MQDTHFPNDENKTASQPLPRAQRRRNGQNKVARTVKRICVVAGLLLCVLLAKPAYRIVRWKVYLWLPSYLSSVTGNESVEDHKKHLMFVMVDHYEPGRMGKGLQAHRRWVRRFCPVAQRHRDSSGNRFRYTWFYAYDHRNEPVLADLSRLAYEGYGEVELHWHHRVSNSQDFPQQLRDAVRWFQRYGALVSATPQRQTQFAFIHGNWALDNSQPRCGVGRELDILFEQGCYADFTFPTVGTVSQPSTVNAIYYANDDDSDKSYDRGVDVQVGQPERRELIIFQGPMAFCLLTGDVEYSAVESYALPNRARIGAWIDANIHVPGRPEWVFAKVYSHGIQSAPAIVGQHLDQMLADLEEECRKRGITLHYTTAREAYNIVKAAEAGKTGSPDQYRDFRLPKPYNVSFKLDGPLILNQ